MRTATLLISLLCISLLAPAARYWRVSQVPAATTSQFELTVEGTAPLGTLAVTDQGPYLIRGFKARQCQGSIAILKLGRNAEGMSILEQRLQHGITRRGVLLEGRHYQQYPALKFTLATYRHKLNSLFSEQASAPVALAYAESGDCQLAEKISLL